MKIKSIDVYVFKYDKHYKLTGKEECPDRISGTDYFFEPHWQQVYSRKLESCIVKITSENNVAGWGEAQAPILPETVASIIKGLIGPFLIGKDASDVTNHVHKMYNMMNVRGHSSGFMIDAISCLEMAMWDLTGKERDKSIAELLGGQIRTTLPAYVSGLRQPSLEEQCEAAKTFRQDGFAGVKLFLGHGLEQDKKSIRAIREAVGPDIRLFADLLWRYSPGEALEISHVLREYGFSWLEAPLRPESISAHRQLAEASGVPLAIGENIKTHQEFDLWFEASALHIPQPDLLRAGFSACKRIAEKAKSLDMNVAPHLGVCSGIGFAATWQLSAFLPNFYIQEYQHDLFPVANLVLKSPLRLEKGELVLPDAPGLAVEVNEDFVRKHSSLSLEIQ